MKLTRVQWVNSNGEFRDHGLYPCTFFHALNWFRVNVIESGGSGSTLQKIDNFLGDPPPDDVRIFGTSH
jgi:hypothetical protein